VWISTKGSNECPLKMRIMVVLEIGNVISINADVENCSKGDFGNSFTHHSVLHASFFFHHIHIFILGKGENEPLTILSTTRKTTNNLNISSMILHLFHTPTNKPSCTLMCPRNLQPSTVPKQFQAQWGIQVSLLCCLCISTCSKSTESLSPEWVWRFLGS